MRAQSFHGGVNRRDARGSGFAGDGSDPVRMLQAADGNKTAAAQLLGVSRATLYEKLATLRVPLS